MAGTNEFASFRCRNMRTRGGGVQNQAEQNLKNAFRPAPGPKSTFAEFWAASNFERSAGEICLSSKRGAPSFFGDASGRFSDHFSHFSDHVSY